MMRVSTAVKKITLNAHVSSQGRTSIRVILPLQWFDEGCCSSKSMFSYMKHHQISKSSNATKVGNKVLTGWSKQQIMRAK
jgi:hypothetical protein